MQFILTEADIEAAIRAYINGLLITSRPVEMRIELAATHEVEGIQATIDISSEATRAPG